MPGKRRKRGTSRGRSRRRSPSPGGKHSGKRSTKSQTAPDSRAVSFRETGEDAAASARKELNEAAQRRMRSAGQAVRIAAVNLRRARFKLFDCWFWGLPVPPIKGTNPKTLVIDPLPEHFVQAQHAVERTFGLLPGHAVIYGGDETFAEMPSEVKVSSLLLPLPLPGEQPRLMRLSAPDCASGRRCARAERRPMGRHLQQVGQLRGGAPRELRHGEAP